MNIVILIGIPFNRRGRNDKDLRGRGERSAISFVLLTSNYIHQRIPFVCFLLY